jgi:hypothetical protein
MTLWKLPCFIETTHTMPEKPHHRVRAMVFNATFNNISAISWRSVYCNCVCLDFRKKMSGQFIFQGRNHNWWCGGAVAGVIVWQLDLQLHMQSVSIATEVVSSNPAQARTKQWCTKHCIENARSSSANLTKISNKLRDICFADFATLTIIL